MSDLKMPISVDQMVEFMIVPISNRDLDFDGAQPNLRFNYHKSLAQCCTDPSKLLKIIDQVSNKFNTVV